MNMNKLMIAIIVIATTSCSNGKLTKLSINCLCSVSEHFVASTDEEDNHTKEFSFTNSKLFTYGVDKEDFALSSAILIKNEFEIDSASVIKISLVTENGNKKKTKSFTYEQERIEQLSPKYYEIETLINEFVSNIYANNFSECRKLTDIQIEEEEFNSIMRQVLEWLEKEYIDTRIVGYSISELGYEINGGVWTTNEILNLFTMTLKEADDGLKIIAFSF